MNINSITKKQLLSWIEKSLENKNLRDYQINITGKSEKGDGYLGDIVFANVQGTTNENGEKVLNFVIKHGKSNDHLRKVSPVKDAFVIEIHFYDKILPIFKKFQLDRSIKNLFDAVPKCYKTLMLDNMEVLVLDNLKKRGYELHDRKKPLNFSHLKAVLTEYGKLHALSFALKDQRKEEFESVTVSRPDVFRQFLVDKGLKDNFQKTADGVRDMLRERKDVFLLEKFEDLMQKNPSDMLLDVIDVEEPQSVILHGDCWNNNFLFKYENDDLNSPSKVRILDWQLSAVRSPVLDLSYLIYVTSSKEELDRFNELMEIYYASLSNFLRQLGSNPEELFSYSDLKRHWRKYSLGGFLIVPMILQFALCNKEDAPSFEDLQEGDSFADMAKVNITEKDLYYERVKDVLNHYFLYTF